jgi:hypothetical protein
VEVENTLTVTTPPAASGLTIEAEGLRLLVADLETVTILADVLGLVPARWTRPPVIGRGLRFSFDFAMKQKGRAGFDPDAAEHYVQLCGPGCHFRGGIPVSLISRSK